MIKYLYASLAALFLLTAGYTYAHSAPTVGDEPKVCAASQVWSGIKEKLESIDGTRVTQLNKGMIQSLKDKAGDPPHAEGDDYDAYLVEQAQMGAVFIVQNGCAVDRLGPGALERLKSMLGISES
jgi:hypothetical protein